MKRPLRQRLPPVTALTLGFAAALFACSKADESADPDAEPSPTPAVSAVAQPKTENTGGTVTIDGGDDDADDAGDDAGADAGDDASDDGGTVTGGGGTTPAAVTLQAGDVLVMRENGGSGVGDGGQIMAFSKTRGYLGYAYDPGALPWYGYGLRLSYDYFADKYYLEAGSSTPGLAISVRRFPWIDAYPHTLGTPTEGPASDAQFFQGAFSEEYNTIRHVAVNDGQSLEVWASGTKLGNCTVTMPAGKYARAIYSGSQSFVWPTFVAYTLGTGVSVTGWGVAKLTGSCTNSGGTPEAFSNLYTDTNLPDAKITSVLQVRTESAPGAGSLRGDLMVTVGSFLYGQTVQYLHYDGASWAPATSPFTDDPYAVAQDHYGDLYTYEYSFGNAAIRRYSVEENAGTHFVETVFTDTGATKLKATALGAWLVVMPPALTQ